MKLYLCGPMTGVAEYNRPAFMAAEEKLREHGFDVHNPAREPEGLTWETYMRRGIAAMLGSCDAVAVLDGGVQRSSGSAMEVWIADRCGMKILTVQKWLARMV